jgi:hypothetical protein
MKDFRSSVAHYFGVNETEIDAEVVAHAGGSLWEWTDLRLQLVFVQSGVVASGDCAASLGTNGGRLDHPFFRYPMHARVGLARAYTKHGAYAFISTRGMPGGATGPTHAPSQPAKVKRGFDRDITWLSKEIVYVEGGDEPLVTPGMSLQEFCEKNNTGDYLVVIASLR